MAPRGKGGEEEKEGERWTRHQGQYRVDERVVGEEGIATWALQTGGRQEASAREVVFGTPGPPFRYNTRPAFAARAVCGMPRLPSNSAPQQSTRFGQAQQPGRVPGGCAASSPPPSPTQTHTHTHTHTYTHTHTHTRARGKPTWVKVGVHKVVQQQHGQHRVDAERHDLAVVRRAAVHERRHAGARLKRRHEHIARRKQRARRRDLPADKRAGGRAGHVGE
eukprot:365377-Chlamydomonas_euryale.AAC.51